MSFVPLILAAFILVVVIIRHNVKAKQKRQLEKLRNDWGKPKQGYFSFNQIEKYSETRASKSYHELPRQLIYDIDFYELFKFVDRTTSKPGQQYLFDTLKRPGNSIETLHALNDLAKVFSSNPPLREEIQKELLRLSHSDAYTIASLLRDKLAKKPGWFNWLFLDSVLVISGLILSLFYPVLLIFLLVPVALNVHLHFWNRSMTDSFGKSLAQLNVLIHVSKNLLQKNTLVDRKEVKESADALRPFQVKVKLLNLGQDAGIKDELSMLASYFLELMKAFFLIEVYTFFHLAKELEDKQRHILTLYRFIGELDVALSIASLRDGNLKTCEPQITPPEKKISVKNIYHPLIKNCVTNNLEVQSRGVLITGSNMSGKTTFLRTLLINSILAQTLYTCFADEYHAPFLKHFSSIRIDDNLMEGKSYYFEEVNVMSALINEVDSGQQNLFILDEVFKGTNTVERIASAKAILSYLNQGDNLVFVSTHDIELSDMLRSEYDLYHFAETIENNELHFDHRLKGGQLKTRNAIRILAISNYPEQIVKEANKISEALSVRMKV